MAIKDSKQILNSLKELRILDAEKLGALDKIREKYFDEPLDVENKSLELIRECYGIIDSITRQLNILENCKN